MSDSKKDLTRIEDLGEYLHELTDEENFIPDLPEEATSPKLMDETDISDFSSASESESSSSFESDINSFSEESESSNDNGFSGESDFSGENDFSGGSDFSSGNDFSGEGNYGGETDFSSGNDFSGGQDFSTENDFSSGEDFSSSSEFGSSEFSEENEFATSSEFSPSEETAEFNTLEEESELFEETQSLSEPQAELKNNDEDYLKEDDTFLDEPQITEPIKTPMPAFGPPPSAFKEPENFEDLKKFAESSSFTSDMSAEGNPSFSVLIKEVKFVEDAQDIILLLKELKLATDSDEVLLNRLSRGELLIPRISEFAATFLAHKLRRFDIDILVGLSDEIHPPKHPETPEIGLVSKHGLYQNQAHHFAFQDHHLDISQIIISATPTLDGHQVIKYIGVASEHKMLDGSLVEDENSTEVSAHYQELAQKLKAHALKAHANAVVGLNYQLTPIPSAYGTLNTRYRLTCTGNLVWINKI